MVMGYLSFVPKLSCFPMVVSSVAVRTPCDHAVTGFPGLLQRAISKCSMMDGRGGKRASLEFGAGSESTKSTGRP